HHPLHRISRGDVVSADQVTDGRARLSRGDRCKQPIYRELPGGIDSAVSALGAGHSPTIGGASGPDLVSFRSAAQRSGLVAPTASETELPYLRQCGDHVQE